jgi:hypothetical protein
MTPPRRFSGLTTVPDAGPTGRRLGASAFVILRLAFYVQDGVLRRPAIP